MKDEQQQQQPETTPDAPTETVETWDGFLASLEDAERERVTRLYEAQTGSLTKALREERSNNKELTRQVREMASKAEKGSDSERQLTEMADRLEASDRRADFYEQAANPKVGLTDVKAAWALINVAPDDYRDRRGNIDFDLLRERHPGLFARTPHVPPGNPGSGSGPQPASSNMNDWIRRRAGRG